MHWISSIPLYQRIKWLFSARHGAVRLDPVLSRSIGTRTHFVVSFFDGTAQVTAQRPSSFLEN